MPKQNYLLLKLLIHVLSKIKNSPLTQLDTFILSIRIAPYVLWDSTCMNLKIFGSDLYQKVRESDFSPWKQSPRYDLGIGNAPARSLMLKDTLGLNSSGVRDALIYFRNEWEGRVLMLLEVSKHFHFGYFFIFRN